MFVASALVLSASLMASTTNMGAGSGGSCSLPWRLLFGGGLDDRINRVDRDPEGNFIVVGYSGGLLGVENFWPIGDSKGFVRKIDGGGVLLWEAVFDTPGIDIVEVAARAPGGNIIIAGRTSGAFADQSNGGQLDLFVAVLSAAGDLLGLLEAGDERPQHPVAVTALSDTTFAVAGYDDVWVWGNAVIDRQNEVIAWFSIGPSGALIKDASFRSDVVAPDWATGMAAARDNSGDVFVSRYDDSDLQYGGGWFVDRVSLGGSIVWSLRLSTLPFDSIAGVAVTRSNRLYAAGTTWDPEVAGGESLGGSDGFLVELDPLTGAKKWARPLGSNESDWIISLAMDEDDNFVLAGITEGVIAPGHTVIEDDPFALLVSSGGNSIGAWQGQRDASADLTYSATRGCGDSFVLAGSLTGIAPIADLGRTDAELTQLAFIRFDPVFRGDFE